MRILMITDFYWPFVGGVEQHVRRLGKALATRGHEVAVVTLKYGATTPFEYDGKVRVYRVRSTMQRATWLFKHPERPWSPPFPDLEVTRALKHVIRYEKPELVHGHDWLARSYLPLKKHCKAKFVMSLHYYTLSCAKKNLMVRGKPCSGPSLAKCLGCASNHYGLIKGFPVTLSNYWLGAAERAAVDMFLPVSQATAVGNGLVNGDRYLVVPNFMPEDNIVTIDVESYLSQLPEEPFLMFVGDLRRDKGIEVLLKAYAGLQDAPPLVLIGKVWAETPKEFPPGVIVFKNWPNEAVLAAWERSLVALVPSLWPEPFGIVVIEAMSSGRPVIASRVGGIPDIIGEGGAGLLVPPDDSNALRQAIEQLLACPALRERMSLAARQRSKEFQASTVVSRIERVYRDLLQKRSDSRDPAALSEHHHQ